MILLDKYVRFSVVATLSTTLCVSAAQAPQHIDIKQLQVTTKVENVVVPVPDEIFAALNKLGPVNWKEYVRSSRGSNFGERPRIALMLGSIIADGFIAVQAQDAPAVKEIGQRVLTLSNGIGVRSSITPHAKAIIEAADKKHWQNVRRELDRTQSSVQSAMNELHDEKLSQLVSLGGWLRGTEVLTSVVTKNFSTGGAELLHQSDLLSYFQTKLQDLQTAPEFRMQLLQEIQDALVEVKPLISVGGQRISAESVKKINEITTRLDYAIVTKD